MKLSLRRYYNGGQSYVDYTDWVESLKISQHAEGLIQSKMPDIFMNIQLAVVLDEEVNPKTYLYWCLENKQVPMVVQKVSRMKNSTELWLTVPKNDFFTFVKGVVTPSPNWRSLFSNFDLEVDDAIVDYSQSFYIKSQEEFLLGIANTTKQKAMIEHRLPKPWNKGSYDGGQHHTIRQVQTAAEFAIEPKPNVAQYKINYEDVIDEQDFNSQVDPNAVVTSRLNQVNSGLAFTYTATTNAEGALDEVKLCECSTSSIFGVSLLKNQTYSELHMSNGAVFNAPGLVIGVTPEVCYVYQDTEYYGSISAIRYDGTVVQAKEVYFRPSHTNKIVQNLCPADRVIQLRQNLTMNVPATDVVLFGNVAHGEDGEFLGVVRYTDSTGLSHLSTILFPGDDELEEAWLLRADPSADGKTVIAVYGKRGSVTRCRITYAGDVIEYGTYDASSNSNVYPVSAQQDTTSIDGPIVVSGYRTNATPRLIFGRTSSSPLSFPPITWAPVTGDQSFMAWFIDYSNVVVMHDTPFKGFSWRAANSLNDYAVSHFNPSHYVCSIGQTSSFVLTWPNGSVGELRTVTMEASPMPLNTYDLFDVTTSTGNEGEGSNISLPFLLQGGNQSWALVPADKTRLKVQVAALTTSVFRSNSVALQAGVTADAYSFMSDTTTKPLPLHTYYMSVEVQAPDGIQAAKASIAWGAERYDAAPPVRIALENTPASNAWVKKSVRVTIPEGYSHYTPYAVGARSENAQASWSFRKPILLDLTAMYGAGNEPDLQWCDENLSFPQASNMVYQPEMDTTVGVYGWTLTNASFRAGTIDEKLPVDNDDIVLPQIGCPILYQRTEDQGVVDNHVIVDCVGGWEDLYIPFNVTQGLTYTVKFDWKVNSTYQPLNQDYPGVLFQVLNAHPTGDGNLSIQVARINLPTQEGSTSQELTFTASATGTYYLDFNFGGATDNQTVDVNVQNIQVLAYGDDVLSDALKSLVNWKQAMPQFTITSTGGLEEGVILGFDYEFGGATFLWVDILLLGQPKPWSDSYLTN